MSAAEQGFAQEAAAVAEDMVRWRRHLHAHPELSFQEHATAKFVVDRLQEFGGLEISTPTKTSVVADLVGGRPGPRLALRADMDALPITEENDFDFASQSAGVMHACGHDGHIAMLLGTARVLTRLRADIPGHIRFIFQHAEELAPGGAKELVGRGVMDGVDVVVGAHLDSLMAVGKIGIKAGPMMASADEFWITINGVGGHAAHPDLTVDCVAIGAQVVTNLQHVVARNVDPREALVLSVTQFHAGTAENVTPGVAKLVGTVRSFQPELRRKTPELMERIVRGITEAHGATYSFEYQYGYEAVINDERVSQILQDAVGCALGAEQVVAAEPSMGAEDFSVYVAKAPGTFFRVGGGNQAQGIAYPHHHARFTVDEAAFPVGVRAFVTGSFALLERFGGETNARSGLPG
jgi:amidohydrolase